MHHYFRSYYKDFIRIVEGLDPQEWIILLLLSIVFGFLCLRGFGSRADY